MVVLVAAKVMMVNIATVFIVDVDVAASYATATTAITTITTAAVSAVASVAVATLAATQRTRKRVEATFR